MKCPVPGMAAAMCSAREAARAASLRAEAMSECQAAHLRLMGCVVLRSQLAVAHTLRALPDTGKVFQNHKAPLMLVKLVCKRNRPKNQYFMQELSTKQNVLNTANRVTIQLCRKSKPTGPVFLHID